MGLWSKRNLPVLLLLWFLLLPLGAEQVTGLRGRRLPSGVELRWDNPASPAAASLRVERRQPYGPYLSRTNLPPTQTSWTDRTAHPEGTYHYRIVSLSPEGRSLGVSAFCELLPQTSAEADRLIRFKRNTVALSAMAEAEWVVVVPKAGRLVVRILSPQAETVRTLWDAEKEAGDYDLMWDGRDDTGRIVRPGVYILSVVTPVRRETSRVVVMP